MQIKNIRYSQIFLEECKYAIKDGKINTINEDLKLSESDDESDGTIFWKFIDLIMYVIFSYALLSATLLSAAALNPQYLCILDWHKEYMIKILFLRSNCYWQRT